MSDSLPVYDEHTPEPPRDYIEDQGPAPMSDQERARFESALREMKPEPEVIFRPGGSWALDTPEVVPAIWGHGHTVAWAKGEPALLVGSDGSGKTVISLNLALRLAGLITEPLLGLPVLPRKRVLYLAQDRPQQTRRALRRMLGTMDRDHLDDALYVVDQPLPPLEDDPELLVRLAVDADADVVIVDSLKDVTRELSSEVTGAAVKRAFSLCCAEGVEVLGNHHDRKAQDGKRRLLRLSDVYGSRLITAGCGSVIALNGTSGDPIVELRQLKQVDEEVGPMSVAFDFETGAVSVFEGSDLLGIVQNSKTGITAGDAARILYQTSKPTNAERERARRSLNRLVDRGLIVAVEGERVNEPTRYCTLARAEPK